MGPRPVVGLTAYETTASFAGRRTEAALVPSAYVTSVVSAGAAPVLLAPAGGAADAATTVSRLDGLVLCGGADVDPLRYGAARHPRTQVADAARDRFESALLAAAAARRLPTLCVCRGAQLLNVVRGGTLHQHLPDVIGHDRHAPEGDGFADTPVTLQSGSRLAGALGTVTAVVACHHHQAIDRVGDGLEVVAWASDGTVEVLEDPAEPNLLAVQWHPEQREDPGLFRWLVTAAGEGAAGEAGRRR